MNKKLVILLVVTLLGGAIVISACAPAIPHTLEGHESCLDCHQTGSILPYPEGHAEKNLENDSCITCHETVSENES